MFNLKIILYWIFIFYLKGLVYAQPPSFDHLTSYNGLSQNAVSCITQDYRGFMWFGTAFGLNRYDGANIKKYYSEPSDIKTLSHHYVQCLLQDSKKTLWVGTAVGLNKLDIETNSIERIWDSASDKGISNHNVHCVYEDREGNIWIGTNNGLNLLTDRGKNTFTKFYAGSEQSIAGNAIRCIFEDDESALWIGTTNGLTRMTKKNDVYQFEIFRHGQNNDGSISFNDISAIAEDASHNIWVGTKNNGLNVFDKNSSTFSQVTMTGVRSNTVDAIKNDQKGNLWIATNDGVYILDPVSKAGTLYQHDASQPKSLNQNYINTIFFDASGSAWVGTYLGGINVAHPYDNLFSTWRENTSGNVVSGITEDQNQNLWISKHNDGLRYLDRKTGKMTKYFPDPKKPGSLSTHSVGMVYTDSEGDIWAGTNGGGIDLFNPGSGGFTNFLYDPANPATREEEVHALLEDSQERFWVGAIHGIKLFRKHNRWLLPDTSVIITGIISFDCIFSIIEDSYNNIWVGGSSGLFVLRKNERKFIQLTEIKGTINCLREDKKGNLWVGLYYDGLLKYNLSTAKTAHYNLGQAKGSQVLSILEDEHDNLWMATDIGLCRFNTNDSTFRFFNPGGEMVVGSNVRNSFYKSKTGEFFFGGPNGFLSFFPDKIQINKVIAPLLFTDLHLSNSQQDANEGDRLLTKDISLTDKILFHYNQNAFTISFALLNYVNSEKNTYAYKLEGLDKDWNFSNNTFITYQYLPTGKYTLLVKGANSNGIWSKPSTLVIEILPPVWRTWWAYLIYILIFVLTLLFTIRYFFRRELKNKQNLN